MDITLLEYFVKVASTQQLSRSAEELNVSQPALSSSIRRLEEELGVRLFDRKGRGISLNDYGRLFLPHAENMLRELDRSKEALRDLKNHKELCVTVSMPPLVSFPGMVSRIREDLPGVILRNTQTDSDSRVKMLLEGSVDFCVMGSLVTRLTDPSVESFCLSTDEMVVILSQNHPMACLEEADLSDFRNENFANISRPGSGDGGDGVMTDLELYCRQAGFRPRVTCWCDLTYEVVEAIRSSDQVALVVNRVLGSYNMDGIRIIRLKNPKCISHLHLYRLRGIPERRAVATVRRSIINYFKETQAPMEE